MKRTKEEMFNDAKLMLTLIRSGNKDAITRFEKLSGVDKQYACLARCQYCIAKENGYSGWSAVK